MKTLGIVGGLGPESTIDYYRLLLAGYRQRTGTNAAPHLFIASMDVTRFLRLVGENDFATVATDLVAEVAALARAGADIALLSANTPHVVFDDVRRASPIPLINIIEAARDAALAMACRRVALFGTRFVMQSDMYPRIFNAAQIEVVPSQADEQTYVHEKYVTELVPGRFLPETREGIARIIDRLARDERIDAVVLAGTELPLLLRDVPLAVPFIDTTKAHVDAALSVIL